MLLFTDFKINIPILVINILIIGIFILIKHRHGSKNHQFRQDRYPKRSQ